MPWVLVDREARRQGGDLEQHAAGLPEVDRLEVIAIADVGDVSSGLADPLLPGQVVLVSRGPGDVVHRAGALPTGLLRWLLVGPAELPLLAVEPVFASCHRGEPERSGHQGIGGGGAGIECPCALDSGDRVLGRDLRMYGTQWWVAAAGHTQLELQTVVVGE